MNDKNLEICEIFSSISGEGLRSGTLATFIRFSGCNMRCSYCDTKYHNEVSYYLDIDYINLNDNLLKKLKNRKFVIITGGEPHCQNHTKLKKLIDWLLKNGTEIIEIETNGKYLDIFIKLLSKYHQEQKVCFSADFKIEYLKDYEYIVSSHLGYEKLNKNDCIKVIVKSIENIEAARKIANRFRNTNVMVSPCYDMLSPTEIAEYITKNNYQKLRMQVQLHKILWEVNAREK